MQSIEILKYGVFDSKQSHGNLKISPRRQVQCFEFDFILSCSENAVSYIDEKSCKISPNMLIIRKPNQISNSKLHFKCYCLHLSVPQTHFLYQDLLSAPDFLTLINEKSYHALFEALMQHLIKQSAPTTDYFVLSKIFDLVYRIKKDAPQNESVHYRKVKQENLSVQKAVDYIKRNYSSAITLDDLGKLTGYSPNHFQRVFSAIVGVSPQKYLENIRINHAKYLLIKNESSITDIAYECGFSSHPHFAKVFKQRTLLTPYEFQKKSRFEYLSE